PRSPHRRPLGPAAQARTPLLLHRRRLRQPPGREDRRHRQDSPLRAVPRRPVPHPRRRVQRPEARVRRARRHHRRRQRRRDRDPARSRRRGRRRRRGPGGRGRLDRRAGRRRAPGRRPLPDERRMARPLRAGDRHRSGAEV
ncbi:unnamed protein product, partial [Penicillium discolor]